MKKDHHEQEVQALIEKIEEAARGKRTQANSPALFANSHGRRTASVSTGSYEVQSSLMDTAAFGQIGHVPDYAQSTDFGQMQA